MRFLLMFCYILMFTSCVSCGESTAEKEKNNTKEMIDTAAKKTKNCQSKSDIFFWHQPYRRNGIGSQ